MSSPPPYVSLVTPVHNGADFIEHSVSEIVTAMEQLDRSFEVIVVCDGSTDGTAKRANAIADPRVRVLRYESQAGKGVAVNCGLAHARGRLVGWLDSDLDVQPDVIVQAVLRFESEPAVDAVVGSKRHPHSTVSYPIIRRIYSWGFQLLVRALFRVNVRDTQVGAKLFRREMLDTVVPLLLVKRYAYDLELLAVAAEFGFERIEEIPITLHYRFSGSGITNAAARRMLIDTMAIAYRIHVRHWYVRRFAALQRARMEASAQKRGLEEDRILSPVDAYDLTASTRPDAQHGQEAACDAG